MICKCIKFRISNEYGQYLNDIFRGTELGEYVLRISNDEVYWGNGKSLFSTAVLTGEEFKQLINLPTYYVVHVGIQVFPSMKDITKLETYYDFLKSKCILTVSVCDCKFVEINIKDDLLFKEIKENTLNYDCFEVVELDEKSPNKLLENT